MVKVRTDSSAQSFYEKPYVKKTLITGVALVSIAAVGCAAYYNRGRLPANPLANRMGWINWDNAKAALITAGKTTAIAIGGIGSPIASVYLLEYIEKKTGIDMNVPKWASSIVGSTVAGSMLIGYPLGAMKTASFVSAAIVGGGIGFLVGAAFADEDEDSVFPIIAGAVAGAGAGLSLAGTAQYVGRIPAATKLIAAATPVVKSMSSRTVELVKNHPSKICKVAFLAFLCFKVLPKFIRPAFRFLREDVLKAKEWDNYEYESYMHVEKTRMLGLALFGLGCFGLFSKSLPVDADFLSKAVAVGLGATIPILACNLTRSSGANLASEKPANEVKNLKARLDVMCDSHRNLDDKFSAQGSEIDRGLDVREEMIRKDLGDKLEEIVEGLDESFKGFEERLENLENASKAEEMSNTQLEEESGSGRISPAPLVRSSYDSDD